MVITAEEITSSWGTFRVVHEENEWFMVGNDMAGILQYSDQQRAVRQRVSAENRHHTTIEASGGGQTITVINEAGCYELVFGSKMPMAKEFQKWVTNEVLPELRKNGHYVMTEGGDNSIFNFMNDTEQKVIDNATRKSLKEKIVVFSKITNRSIQSSWKEFVAFYNRKKDTNLVLRKTNMEKKVGHDLNLPEFIELEGIVKEANEILDEMIDRGCNHGITSDEVILSKEEYQEMKFKAESYSIINNQYQNFVSALQAEHIHWVNDYKRFVCDVIKMMNIRKINSMKNNEIALRFDDIPWEYMQYAIATNDPNQPFIVDFDKLNANIY